MHTVQKRTWEENGKFMFHISDEINGNLFLLEEADSVRRMPGDRAKHVCPRSTATRTTAYYIPDGN